MATFTTSPGNAVAIAQRLLKANVPFDLRVGESGTIDCQFEETLNLVVYQQELAILRNGGAVTRKHTDRGAQVRGTPNGLTVKPRPVDDEQWYADTPDGDSALVTRVAALCNHPSMSFHQVALLEGAISESKADRKPASVDDTPACPMTDTEFDSDPSVVME